MPDSPPFDDRPDAGPGDADGRPPPGPEPSAAPYRLHTARLEVDALRSLFESETENPPDTPPHPGTSSEADPPDD